MPEVLSRAVLQTEGTGFSYMDRPRPVNNIYIYICIYKQLYSIFSICFSSVVFREMWGYVSPSLALLQCLLL